MAWPRPGSSPDLGVEPSVLQPVLTVRLKVDLLPETRVSLYMIGELLFGGAFVLAGLLTVGFGDVRAVARGRRDPLLPVRWGGDRVQQRVSGCLRDREKLDGCRVANGPTALSVHPGRPSSTWSFHFDSMRSFEMTVRSWSSSLRSFVRRRPTCSMVPVSLSVVMRCPWMNCSSLMR